MKQWLVRVAQRIRANRSASVVSAPDQIALLKRLLRQGPMDEAISVAERALTNHGGDKDLLRQVRATFSKTGSITLHLRALQAERHISDAPTLAKHEGRIRGRLRETSETWRPEVGGSVEPVEPASSNRVLHLLKAATPERQSGYTMRSKYTLEGQRTIGLEPIAMTALGFGRSLGVTDLPPREVSDGILRIRLEPGDQYELDKPADQYLQDYTDHAASVVRDLAPAVLHVHSGHRGYEAACVALALGRHFNLPVVYEVRGFFESLWTSNIEWADKSEIFNRRLETENRCMTEADAIVTLSKSMRDEIIARGIPADKVFVVPNGVDVAAFQPRKRRTDLVKQLSLDGRFVFGYVSNLDHFREGQELLIDAAVELRNRGIRATALIVGDGSRREQLERHAEHMDARDSVKFTGRVSHEEVLDYYSLMDVFVVPRVKERAAQLVTPLKPLEAMAAGVPVVASDLEALREITGGGQRGRHFTPGDSQALADVLGEMHADPMQRAEIAESARTWVVTERQWSANGRRYAEIYSRVTDCVGTGAA